MGERCESVCVRSTKRRAVQSCEVRGRHGALPTAFHRPLLVSCWQLCGRRRVQARTAAALLQRLVAARGSFSARRNPRPLHARSRRRLGGQSLQGPYPARPLPATLQTLDLGQNELTGPLPAALEVPAGLSRLDLHANQFSGTIPAALALPAALERLHLGFNQLSGTIPQVGRQPHPCGCAAALGMPQPSRASGREAGGRGMSFWRAGAAC